MSDTDSIKVSFETDNSSIDLRQLEAKFNTFDLSNLEKHLQTGKTTKEIDSGVFKIEASDTLDVEKFSTYKSKAYSFNVEYFSETKTLNRLTRAKTLLNLTNIYFFFKIYTYGKGYKLS